jgi:hypothetical protein
MIDVQRNSSPSATLLTTNQNWTNLEVNHGLRGTKLARIKFLKYKKALEVVEVSST